MIPFPDKVYNIIYADPPWLYNDARTKASAGMARSAYECMPVEDICALPVRDLRAYSSLLALWTTFPKLREGLRVLEAWGFEFITVGFVWVKINPKATWPLYLGDFYSGLGHYTRANAEIVLFGRSGPALPRYDISVKQIVVSPRGVHSAKPPIVRTRLERLFGSDVSRIELFARERVPGWDAWGNGVS